MCALVRTDDRDLYFQRKEVYFFLMCICYLFNTDKSFLQLLLRIEYDILDLLALVTVKCGIKEGFHQNVFSVHLPCLFLEL